MRELTKNQKWYYKKIMGLGKNKEVVNMSYDELFLTLDRVKFAYLLDFITKDNKLIIIPKNKLGFKLK